MAYLLGHPVAHSLSPAMHNAAFAATGLPHRYETWDVAPERLADAVARLRDDDVLGANVTVPHKETVMPLLDELDAEARRIGAVNTIVRDGPRLRGTNTDAYGFRRAIADRALSGRTALVLGAGGAARVCVAELLERGSTVLVANRHRARADALVAEMAGPRGQATAVDWPDGSLPAGVDAVVNATTLGLEGEDPLGGYLLPRVVVDLAPTARETPLVARARAAGRVTVDGLVMLLHQAARAFELWTGRPAPIEVMRAALPRPVP